MKNLASRPEVGRWKHALTRPLSGHRITFELLELMRADLFEYLDHLTTMTYDDAESRAWINKNIQQIADRLKEMTLYRAHAARAAMKAGRIEYAYVSHADETGPQCGPFSGPAWQELHRQWENAR